MTLENEAPILKKIFDFYKIFYQCVKIFPKKDQYSLGKRCEDYLLLFMECVVLAASLPKERKLKALEVANMKFDMLKIFIRLAHELKMIDNKKYLALGTEIQEIGKMLGGWIRSLNTKTP